MTNESQLVRTQRDLDTNSATELVSGAWFVAAPRTTIYRCSRCHRCLAILHSQTNRCWQHLTIHSTEYV